MPRTKKYQMGGLAAPMQREAVYFDAPLTVPEGSQSESFNPEAAIPLSFRTQMQSPPPPAGAMGTVNMPEGMRQPTMARGGALLQEGGMLQEGGTVDPVSGNEVPVGSMQEEVRDDIPAKLSEGEFVFPADVVRFIGLERLMKMRQAAKEGLRKMEAMGQMGNSEEATMDDEGDFETDLDDILAEIEKEKRT
jgi:hypothetical protein